MTDPPNAIGRRGGGPTAAEPPAAIRTALVSAIGRRRRRTRVRVAIAAGACAALVTAVLGSGLSADGPSPALAIETTGAWVEVRVVDADNAEAAAMTAQLQDAGINIEVRVMPVPPSLVGSWMGIRDLSSPPPDPDADATGPDPAPAPLLGPGESRMTHNVFAIPRDAVHKLAGHQFVLYVGRAPQPGERPQMLFWDGPHPVDPDDPLTPLGRPEAKRD